MALTSADVTRLRMELGLTHKELARFLDVKEGTIKHWESGITKIHGPAARIAASFLLFSSEDPEMYGHLRVLIHKSHNHGCLEYVMSFLLGQWKLNFQPLRGDFSDVAANTGGQ